MDGGKMKIFIDTAKINEIEEVFSWGIIDGVTTNPSLIKAACDEMRNKGEKIDMESYIKRMLEVTKGYPVSLEVIGTNFEDMYKEAKILYEKFNKVANNVVIKIPINPSLEEKAEFDGLKTIYKLSKEGIPVNVTLIMKVEQAILAAKAGAKYVSPFAGRIDDYLRSEKMGWKDFKKDEYYPENGVKFKEEIINDEGIVSGVNLVREIVEIFNKYNLKTEIIAASIRNSRQVREIAETGAHIATIPFYVLKDMLVHFKTSEGMRRFVSDVVPEYRNLFK
jgi:transaldolase